MVKCLMPNFYSGSLQGNCVDLLSSHTEQMDTLRRHLGDKPYAIESLTAALQAVSPGTDLESIFANAGAGRSVSMPIGFSEPD